MQNCAISLSTLKFGNCNAGVWGKENIFEEGCNQCCIDIYQCWVVIKNSTKPSMGIIPGIRVGNHSYKKKQIPSSHV